MSDFLIGAATAAHQVEGNNIHSDFWVMENLKHSDFAEPSGLAVDHYNRYEEDIKLLADAGCSAYRFSIEWARIEPEEGRYDYREIGHYRKVLHCCRENGITPIVTLHHFSSPAWLIRKGGWTNERTVDSFAKYARYVAMQLKDELEYVCTINEANMGFQLHKVMDDMKKASQREGSVQVGVQLDMKKILLSMLEQGVAFRCNPLKIGAFLRPRSSEQEKIVMRSHQAAKQALKSAAPQIKVGLTLSLFDYQSVDGGEAVAARLWQEDFGQYLPYIQNDDFLGVQNYSRTLIGPNGSLPVPEGAEITQMEYEYYPEGLAHVLRRVAKDFHGDLIVTENGIATADDSRRAAFIDTATQGVADCIADGLPVKGYFYWSLLDNFEWQKGYAMTFGLVGVNRETQQRQPKASLSFLGTLR